MQFTQHDLRLPLPNTGPYSTRTRFRVYGSPLRIFFADPNDNQKKSFSGFGLPTNPLGLANRCGVAVVEIFMRPRSPGARICLQLQIPQVAFFSTY